MKFRNPSLLSNSGLPRRAAALPKRPNFMFLRFYCWAASLETTTPAGRHNPRSTALVTQATCTLLLASPAPSPLNQDGEHHYALPIRGDCQTLDYVVRLVRKHRVDEAIF